MKVAGIDLNKKVLMVAVVNPSMVMESTARCWRSVWLELEPHFGLHLAQAFFQPCFKWA